MPECCIGFFKDKTADEATIDLSADMHFVGMKVGFVRVLRFLTGCSVSTVSFPAKTTPLNDRIGDMGCVATTHVPQLRENAASAKSEKRMTAKCHSCAVQRIVAIPQLKVHLRSVFAAGHGRQLAGRRRTALPDR